MLAILDRPLRRDRQGVVHAGYAWTRSTWEPCCEERLVNSKRDTDEPPGSVITCLLCWQVLLLPRDPEE